MALSRKDERSLLNHDEWTLVSSVHHPEIAGLDLDELHSARHRLRAMRDKERDMGARVTKSARGKTEMRGGSHPGTKEGPRYRNQVFTHALRRTNAEITRRQQKSSRTEMRAIQERALAMKRAAPSHRPDNIASAAKGPANIVSTKRKTRVVPAKVGSVSQQTKNSQAKRDR